MPHAADVTRPLRTHAVGAAHFVVQVLRHLGGAAVVWRRLGAAEPEAGQQHREGGDRGHGGPVQAAVPEQEDEGGMQRHAELR